jgi:hypothetical protein
MFKVISGPIIASSAMMVGEQLLVQPPYVRALGLADSAALKVKIRARANVP